MYFILRCQICGNLLSINRKLIHNPLRPVPFCFFISQAFQIFATSKKKKKSLKNHVIIIDTVDQHYHIVFILKISQNYNLTLFVLPNESSSESQDSVCTTWTVIEQQSHEIYVSSDYHHRCRILLGGSINISLNNTCQIMFPRS